MSDESVAGLRRLMFSIAYRMTGSVNDAEDMAQEAFARLARVRRDGVVVDDPRAWLSAVTTRIAIDHLRSARVTREAYVGPWLPEPLLVDDEPGPAQRAEISDSLSQAFLLVLERLTPVERAVFLLREVFGVEYDEIAETVGRSPANCRQIARRAREHVEDGRPRFTADRRRRDELMDRFLAAAEDGDVAGLTEMLAADAILYADGGGKASSARKPVYGADRIARFMAGTSRKRRRVAGMRVRRATVNGQPGRVVEGPDGDVLDVLAIDVVDDLIVAVRIMRNPEKLRHLATP